MSRFLLCTLLAMVSVCSADPLSMPPVNVALPGFTVDSPWVAALRCDALVRARLERIEPVTQSQTSALVRISVLECMRGQVPSDLTIVVGPDPDGGQFWSYPDPHDEWIVCLFKPNPPEANWTSVNPMHGHTAWCVKGGMPVEKPEDFVAGLHVLIREHPHGLVGAPLATVASDRYLERVLWTEGLLEVALKLLKSGDGIGRLQAIGVLNASKTPEADAALHALLDDPFSTSRDEDTCKLFRENFPVRKYAYDSLVNWGEHPNRPIIDLPDDAYRPVGWRRVVFVSAVGIFAILVAATARRLLRLRISLARLASSATLCLAAVALILVWRGSPATTYQFAKNVGTDRFEICSAPRGVQVTFVTNWTKADEGVITLPRGSKLDQLTDIPTLSYWTNFPRTFDDDAWFPRGHGSIQKGPLRYAWQAVIVPYPALLVCLGIPMASMLSWRVARKCFARGNRCRKCHYDLRASAGRCPECGTPIPEPKRQWQDVVREEMAAEEARRRNERKTRDALADQLSRLTK